ncbi:MAG: hypothetical protein ACLRY8_17305, partial [Clostridium butyricum]
YNIYEINVEENDNINISINILNNKFNDNYDSIEIMFINWSGKDVFINNEKIKVDNNRILINKSKLNCD